MTKPKNYDLVLTRLLCIIKYLCIDERKTIKELSDEFNVSVRTIQKDIYERLPLIIEIDKDHFGRLVLTNSTNNPICQSLCKGKK